MKRYQINYRIESWSPVQEIEIEANSKADAWDAAMYEEIRRRTGEVPYSVWVVSVTYKNGRVQKFNTCEGLGY